MFYTPVHMGMNTKIFLITAIVLVTTMMVSAQTDGHEFSGFLQQHINHQKTGMIMLGSWGLANALTGGIGGLRANGENKYFHQMNLGWGLVNAAIAGFGYYSAARMGSDISGILDLLQANQSLQKTLLVNAGLDVAYMMGGLYLMERSRRPDVNQERLKGFGKSIIMQGAFLLVFDGVMAWNFNRNGKEMIEFIAAPGGLGLSITF